MQTVQDRPSATFAKTTLVVALLALAGCQVDPEAAQAGGADGVGGGNAGSQSAAQLTDDDTHSLSDALAAAASARLGESNAQTDAVTSAPATGAAMPLSEAGNAVIVMPETGQSGMDQVEQEQAETQTPAAQASEPGPTVDSSEDTSASGESDADAQSPTDGDVAESSEPQDATTAGSDSDSRSPAASGTDTTTPASSTDDSGDVSSTIGERFTSSNTDGFDGTVTSDGSILVRWPEDRTARGYNLYRDGEYYLTVFDIEHLDKDTTDGSYYYEVQAFDHAENYQYIARGLTVKVRGSGREAPEAKQAAGVDLTEFDLVFSDEFDGQSLDLDKWDTSYIWGDGNVINSELQHYVDTEKEPDFGFDPFTVADGKLTISSVATPAQLSDKANDQPYLSGVITSYEAFKFTYGYAEARARTPYGKGLWSAFWLLNAYYDSNGDADPEIDIMEHIGDNQDTAYHTYHYYDNGELRSTEAHAVKGVDFTAEYHTFAVDWRPGVLVYYIDGVETKRITDPNVSSEEMYVIANTALGGWWPGSPDETTPFPAEYDIDYIRVYQKRTAYDDPPLFNDGVHTVPLADQVNGDSPNHRPSADQFPGGVRP